MSDVAEIADGLSDKAYEFLLGVGIASWWRTEEGERIPGTLLTKGLIERDRTGGIDFAQYRLTPLGNQVRTYLESRLP